MATTDAYRKGQSVVISDLSDFIGEEIGMLSIVIVGSSRTARHGDRLITPGGYETNMPIPSKEVIIRRLERNRLDPGCAHYPVTTFWRHVVRASAYFIRAGIRPLAESIISRKGAKVWSCKECEWIHGKEPSPD